MFNICDILKIKQEKLSYFKTREVVVKWSKKL